MQGFKLPLEKLKNEPIKKTYDYYKTNDNLWNSKYLSSPKIAKYYLDPQELYLTGPLCPFNLSVIDSTERSQAAHDKATKNKLNSRQMLIERKKERETLKSRQTSLNIESFLRAKPNTSKRNKFYSGKYENFEKIFGKNNFNDLKASSFRGNTANKEGQRWKDNSLQPVKKHLTRKWVQIIRKNSVFPNIQNQISLKTYEKGKEKWKNLRNVVKKPKDFPIKIKEKINQSMVEEILKDIEGIESAYSQRLSQRLDD